MGTQNLLTTQLHDWHQQANANMAEFGGYHMPLWYQSGAKDEHLAVITSAGLFDTSHMAVIEIKGSGSFKLLQKCFSKDLARCIGRDSKPLKTGRSVYGVFLQEDGSVLDDSIISCVAPDHYLVVVNSGMGRPVSQHLSPHADDSVIITDGTGQYGKIDIQGPNSARILEKVLKDPDSALTGLGYFSFRGSMLIDGEVTVQTTEGTPVLLSRTGYTGEFGFELFVRSEDTQPLWQQLLAAGREYRLTPCGLAARDSLRVGALLPLSHQDIGGWLFGNTPWDFVLPYGVDGTSFTKDFIGAEALNEGAQRSYTYGFAGFDPRKIPLGPDTVVSTDDGEQIGIVLTCATDMAIGRVGDTIFSIASPVESGKPADFKPRGLSCGFVKTQRECAVGDFLILSEGKRKIKVEIRDEVRPDRTARCGMKVMRQEKD